MRVHKKLSALVCAAALALGLAFTTAQAVSQAEIDALEAQRDGISAQKSELKTKLNELEQNQETLLEQKRAIDEQIELLRQEIELIGEQIDLYARLIEQKEIEIEEAVAEEELQQERLRVRVRAMEENGSAGYISIILGASDFKDLLSRLDFVKSVMDYDKNLYDTLVAQRLKVEQVKAEYEALLEEMKLKEAELEASKAELDEQSRQADELIAQLVAQIAEHQELFDRYSAELTELQADIDRKTKELQSQAAAGTGTYIWPQTTSNLVVSPYGYRIHPIYGDRRFHYGIDINGYTGDAIVAADSGTVALATYGSGYGNYIMINHGNGNATLYAHMSSMAVSAGQTVTQGQVIGYVGSTGASTGPHLHYEIRVNGATVDPLKYYTGYTTRY